MNHRMFFPALLLFSVCFFPALQAAETQNQTVGQISIVWQDWTPDIFEKAKTEDRFVLLDLEAVWCHWCHVMDDTTYRDPKVVELIQSKYLPVKVDQDAHPDLSNRYEDYGWPATIIFGPDGKEIVKRRGYIPPEGMASILAAVIADPTPGPSVRTEAEVVPAKDAFLTAAQKSQLEEQHIALYDSEFGSWGTFHKLIDIDDEEYALNKSSDEKEAGMARTTLDQALNLLDPEWGGFYQYSDERNWKSPHFEKIMPVQAQYMQIYSLAYSIFGKSEYLRAGEETARYIKDFLTGPEGAFYTSQDADLNLETDGHKYFILKDAERRALGIPTIDKHIYSRENGWMIAALSMLYDVSGKEEYLKQAETAADWILQHRAIPGGGFRHDETDKAGPFLGDTLAMAQAFLNLHSSSGDRRWLIHVQEALGFIESHFKDESGGFDTIASERSKDGVFQKSVKQIDENINMVRLAIRLYHFTANEKYKTLAEHAMRYAASPALIENRKSYTALLLADSELADEPIHIAIVGHKDDAKAKELHREALRYPSGYKRVEWWDKREGPLANPDVTYPELAQAAAFACANKSCSLPVFDPQKVSAAVDRLRKITV